MRTIRVAAAAVGAVMIWLGVRTLMHVSGAADPFIGAAMVFAGMRIMTAGLSAPKR